VPCPQAVGNDQIEGVPQRLGGRVPKKGLSARVPEPNNTLAVGEDDRVLRGVDDVLTELLVGIGCHGSALLSGRIYPIPGVCHRSGVGRASSAEHGTPL
jgi:hypothetical protein